MVEEEKMGFVSLHVASWFAAAVMERCIGKLQTAAALHLAFVSGFELELKGMFTVGSVTGPVQKTSSYFHMAMSAIISNEGSSGGELLSWHVLGLRIEQAKVAVTFAFLFLLDAPDGFHIFVQCFFGVLWAEVVVQQHAAVVFGYVDEQLGVCVGVSEHASQAKTSARVDVPETPMANRQGQGVELVEMKLKEKEEESFPVFLRTLQGRHHVIACTAGMLLSDLHEQVAIKCHCQVISSCWCIEARLCKGLALWVNGVSSVT